MYVNKLREKFTRQNNKFTDVKYYSSSLTCSLSSFSLLNYSDIPVFGVLTHADKIDKDDTDFPEFEKKFKTSLGLTGMRYLLCSSYCDEISNENRRNPKIEVPVMRFLRQVRQFIIFNLCTCNL